VSLFFHEHVLVLVLANSSLTLFAILGIAGSIILGKLYRTTEVLTRTRDELKDANQRLAEHADALSRSNAELERFAYAVAHDLNASLRTISTRTEFCLQNSDAKIDRGTQESLSIVAKHAKSMSRLIENLLTLARVKNDQADNNSEVKIRSVVERALEHLRDEVYTSGAIIAVQPLPVVRTHEDQLLRAFQNLISNGVKYRSEEPPTIHTSADRLDRDWRFLVSDNGIGIDPKHHAQIFEPFHRLHNSATYEGSGVGLAICKRIVEQHGGRIWVESAVGAGSRFYITLPVVEGASQPSKRSAQSAGNGSLQKHANA